jgi:hypothetical protein
VWHASISPRDPLFGMAKAWTVAEQELRGVGDAALGEWREHGDIAVHIRRRVTPREMHRAGLISVVDVRGTPEHARRVERLRPFLPLALRQLPLSACV